MISLISKTTFLDFGVKQFLVTPLIAVQISLSLSLFSHSFLPTINRRNESQGRNWVENKDIDTVNKNDLIIPSLNTQSIESTLLVSQRLLSWTDHDSTIHGDLWSVEFMIVNLLVKHSLMKKKNYCKEEEWKREINK